MTDLVSRVTEMIESHQFHKPYYELEIRLGKFCPTHFEAGMPNDCIRFIGRLNKRLSDNAHKDPAHWRIVADYLFMRPRYPNNIRGTIIPNTKSVFVYKRVIGQINVPTDRPFDLRVALSEEAPIDMNDRKDIADMVQRSAPESVQFVRRTSYQEILPDNSILQYDVSKTSKEMPNKFQATQHPCTYHVELELVHVGDGMNTRRVAEIMLARAKALLGTHRVGTQEALPAPMFL